jgi:hypothetical protein
MAHGHLRIRGDLPWLVVGAGVLATLLVVIAGLYSYDTRAGGPLDPQTVHVTSVGWSLSGTSLTSGAGVSFHAGSPLTVKLAFTCGICGTVTMTTASTNTSGFSVTSSNLPLVIPAGETGNISVTVSTPRVDYSGALAIELN